jgi:SRSO17 transposase
MDIQYVQETLAEGLEELMNRIGRCYANNRGREHALKYVMGLLSPIGRKNGWQLAEARGDKTPYAIQQFLFRGRWSAGELRDSLQGYVREHLGDENGVLIVDETGFLKKGKKSAGVMRQYSGTAGRVENCQVGVFLNYSGRQGFSLIDRELYLPKEWIEDEQRCREAGIPEGTEFTTKVVMALEMLKRAHGAGLPFSWATADSLYGDSRSIRLWLESIEKAYVLAVSGKRTYGKG